VMRSEAEQRRGVVVEDRFRFDSREFRHVRRLFHRPQLLVAHQRRVPAAMRNFRAREILPSFAPGDVVAVHAARADVVRAKHQPGELFVLHQQIMASGVADGG